MVVDKPWGHELLWAHTDRYVGKILHVEAGHALSLQYHERKDEMIHLWSGELQLVLDEGEGLVAHVLRPGESYHVKPFTKHRMAELTAFHSGQKIEQIQKDSERDRWFSPEQAKEYGLVDKVIVRRGEIR